MVQTHGIRKKKKLSYTHVSKNFPKTIEVSKSFPVDEILTVPPGRPGACCAATGQIERPAAEGGDGGEDAGTSMAA